MAQPSENSRDAVGNLIQKLKGSLDAETVTAHLSTSAIDKNEGTIRKRHGMMNVKDG
jgi:hypothetical protein